MQLRKLRVGLVKCLEGSLAVYLAERVCECRRLVAGRARMLLQQACHANSAVRAHGCMLLLARGFPQLGLITSDRGFGKDLAMHRWDGSGTDGRATGVLVEGDDQGGVEEVFPFMSQLARTV